MFQTILSKQWPQQNTLNKFNKPKQYLYEENVNLTKGTLKKYCVLG